MHRPMRILRHLWTEGESDPEVRNTYQYVFELRDKLQDTLKIAREELKQSQTK